MAATNDYVDISKGKLTFGLYAAENFRNLIEQQPLALAMKNSFIYAISVTIICLFICSLAGKMVRQKSPMILYILIRQVRRIKHLSVNSCV